MVRRGGLTRQGTIGSNKKAVTIWLEREKLPMNYQVVPFTYYPIKSVNHRGQSLRNATWRSTFEKQSEVHS